ncbi:hypothetical protein EV121DRAFT_274537 [Schizophyllum commune]
MRVAGEGGGPPPPPLDTPKPPMGRLFNRPGPPEACARSVVCSSALAEGGLRAVSTELGKPWGGIFAKGKGYTRADAPPLRATVAFVSNIAVFARGGGGMGGSVGGSEHSTSEVMERRIDEGRAAKGGGFSTFPTPLSSLEKRHSDARTRGWGVLSEGMRDARWEGEFSSPPPPTKYNYATVRGRCARAQYGDEGEGDVGGWFRSRRGGFDGVVGRYSDWGSCVRGEREVRLVVSDQSGFFVEGRKVAMSK